MDVLDTLVRAVGWTLIHSLWIGSVIGAVYAVAVNRWRASAPHRAHDFGIVGLIVLALSLVAVFVREWVLAGEAAYTAAVAQATLALPQPGIIQNSVVSTSGEASWATAIDASLPWLVAAWALAVLLLAGSVARSHLALRRLVTAGVALPELAQPVLELAQQFGVRRGIAVVSSACAKVPFVIGHFAPVIVLPLTIATGMPWPQLRLILAHEIAHLRRADYLINWLQIALEVLLFFHPVVRWVSADLRRVREDCCDDLVIQIAGGRADYARALLSLEEFRQEAPRLAPSAAAGALLWRVQRIAGRTPASRAVVQRLLTPLAVVSFAALLLATGSVQAPGGRSEVAVPRNTLVAYTAPLMQALLSPAELSASLPAAAPGIAIEPAFDLPAARLPALALALADTPAPMTVNWSPTLSLPAPRLLPAVESAIDPMTPLYQRAPMYPESERLRGRRVTVEVSYLLDADGRVVDMLAEDPPPRASAFIAEAKRALVDWRYSPDAARRHAGQRLSQRFAFRLGDTEVEENCRYLTGTRICRK